MADTQPLAPTDAELLALNEGEVYFSESPSKYPEAGHGTQYHAGAPGVLAFAREVLAKWGAQPVVPSGYALVPAEPTPEMVDAAQEAYMPFGDMALAIQLAIAAAPQTPVHSREPVGYTHASWITAAKRGSGGHFAGRQTPGFDVPLYLAPQPVVREPLTSGQLEAAAKVLAASFDYPWDHMPEKGRETMRGHVRAVIAAATASSPLAGRTHHE